MSLSLKYVSNVSLTLFMFFLTQKIETNLDRKCLELLRSNGHLSFPTGLKSNPKSAVSDSDSQHEDELVDAEEMERDNPSDAASDEDIFQTPKRKSALKIPPPKKPRKLRRIAYVNRKAATSAAVSDSDSFQEEEGVEHMEGERPSDAESGVDIKTPKRKWRAAPKKLQKVCTYFKKCHSILYVNNVCANKKSVVLYVNNLCAKR